MIVTKYLCDRCGKEVKRNKIYKTTILEGLDECAPNCAYSCFHLCEDCVKIFFKWLKSHE